MTTSPLSSRRSHEGRHLVPRLRILSAVIALVLIAAWPTAGWRTFCAAVLVLAVLQVASGRSWRRLARRGVVLFPFVVVLIFSLVIVRSSNGISAALAVVAKMILSLWTVDLLISSMPTPTLLCGLAHLGLPKLLVATMALAIRYVEVARDEFRRMARARQARVIRARRLADWRDHGRFAGTLFLRSLARSERVHQAMLARGWNGDMRLMNLSNSDSTS